MSTQQPKWKYIAQLGDAHPIDHGGYFIYVDETGVYAPEGEYLQVPHDADYADDDGKEKYIAYRFSLNRCTYENGVLSDNPYHKDHPAWFFHTEQHLKDRPQDGKHRLDCADCCGWKEEEMIQAFCSEDPLVRARAWESVGSYHGFENLDGYPLRLTRKEAKERYAEELKIAW